MFTKDNFVSGGKFRLPLYQGDVPKPPSGKVVPVATLLAQRLAQRKVKIVEGASVVVRLADARRHREYGGRLRPTNVDEQLMSDKKYGARGSKSKSCIECLPRSLDPDAADELVAAWMEDIVERKIAAGK